ncbi:MAG: hypothetical protein GXO31_02855 [Epsilonproteobacteria bacterium]|nr:hypothetical protein [Campylobacterota bacterium]
MGNKGWYNCETNCGHAKELQIEYHENPLFLEICCKAGKCIDVCEGSSNGMGLERAHPCFKIKWGDGPEDRLETDDVEIMCLVAKNCFSDIAFEDIEIKDIIISSTNVVNNGSILIKPCKNIYIKKLDPCKEATREIVLITRRAAPGEYIVHLVYEYTVCGVRKERRVDFLMNLTAS